MISTDIRTKSVESNYSNPNAYVRINISENNTKLQRGMKSLQQDVRRKTKSRPARSGPKPAGASSRREPEEGHDEGNSACGEGQEIKFINIPSGREKLSLSGTRRNDRHIAKHSHSEIGDGTTERDINPKEILASAQESSYGRVYEADLHGAEITRINNLESFTKLRILNLSSNCIDRIDNLKYNPELRELKLYDNRITDVENLDRLKELCHLQLQHNRITSLGKGLQSLKKLKVLRLDSNLIFKLDVREIASCAQLTSLDLSNNKLDNLTAVNCLPNLEELFVTGNRLRVVADISRCRKLQEIDLSHNRLTDLSGLKTVASLKVLHASHNQLTSVKSLGKMRGIEELNLAHNRLTATSYFPDFYASLQICDLSDNHIESWQEVVKLKGLSELAELYISGNPICNENGPMSHYITDLQTLMPNLEVLDGATLKKMAARPTTPLMRPMSASSVISAKQVDNQLQSLDQELSSFESEFSKRFSSLQAALVSLPENCPSTSASCTSRSTPGNARPTSKCGKRSRIQEARNYAMQHL